MKKFILILSLFAFTIAPSIAQEGYVMFLGLYLDPIPGKSLALVDGVKEHNKKFHAKGEELAYLWNVVTGPKSGQYIWAQGPLKYASMDAELSREHNLDWESKVAIHCKDISEMSIWKRANNHTYNPENEVVGENVLARFFYGVRDMDAALGVIKKIKDVLEAKKVRYARRVYTSEFKTKNGEDIMLIYPFTSWMEFETKKGLGENFEKEYDQVNGQGSWLKARAILDKSADGWYDEVRIMVK